MKVESFAEWSILQYFWPAFSDNWSWKPIVGLFESGHFTQEPYCVFTAAGEADLTTNLWLTG